MAPTITFDPETPVSGYYATAPTITVAGPPTVGYLVEIDGGAPVAYAGPFTPVGLTDGTHTVVATGTDGGISTSTFQIDGGGPTITPVLTGPSGLAGWRTGPTTVTFECTDTASGVAGCTPASTISADGTYDIVGTATDNAGNTSSVTAHFQIDATAPLTTEANVVPGVVTEGESFVVSISGTDSGAGVDAAEYSIGDPVAPGSGTPMALVGDEWQGTVALALAPGTYQVVVRLRDAAGNWSTDWTGSVEVQTASGPGAIQVTVTSFAGAPLTRAQVRLYDPGRGSPIRLAVTDADGFVELAGVQPGQYLVEALPPRSTLQRRWFDAPSRATALVVDVPSLGTVPLSFALEARS